MGLAANNLRSDVLESNNILLCDGVMREESWSDLAFSLGLPARGNPQSTVATRKCAQRVRKRKVHSAAQTYDLIKPFIESLTSTCLKLSQQNRCVYHGDAVPTVNEFKNTVNRLPIPKPVISVGYHKGAFSFGHDELQNGLITDQAGEPCDLKHISQPVLNHFWPFLIVEISDLSIAAARQDSAISAATCNNALVLLAGAAAENEKDWSSTSFAFDYKFARSFSLSLHGKTAVLSTHCLETNALHVATEIARYQLDEDNDIASLADRLHSIMIWGEHNRLAEIMATLDQLDRKVHGPISGMSLTCDGYDFDPHCLKTLKLQPPKRPDRMKVVFKAGIPSWLARS